MWAPVHPSHDRLEDTRPVQTFNRHRNNFFLLRCQPKLPKTPAAMTWNIPTRSPLSPTTLPSNDCEAPEPHVWNLWGNNDAPRMSRLLSSLSRTSLLIRIRVNLPYLCIFLCHGVTHTGHVQLQVMYVATHDPCRARFTMKSGREQRRLYRHSTIIIQDMDR